MLLMISSTTPKLDLKALMTVHLLLHDAQISGKGCGTIKVLKDTILVAFNNLKTI